LDVDLTTQAASGNTVVIERDYSILLLTRSRIFPVCFYWSY